MEQHPAEKLAFELDNVALSTSNEQTHVFQVWEDGEITMQKCGDLLWQRSLHSMESSLIRYVAGLKLPHDYGIGHSYAFVTKEDAIKIRALIEIK